MLKKNTERHNDIPIREVRLESEVQKSVEQNVRKSNTELVIVTYIFAAMFFLMIAYLTWFLIAKRTEINANVYNSKQESASDRIIRGPITAEDGTSLAYTTVDYTGNETRVYPYYNIFAHVIGYADNGRGGLEATVSSDLMNCHSSLVEQIRSSGSNEKLQGDTVVVTLRPSLQEACWYALGSYKGAVVVMEPDSGKILAMVSKPDFDPNVIAQTWDSMVSDPSNSSLLNRATQGLYPPGSTFKILTTLAYLRQFPGGYTNFSYDCTGTLSQGDMMITCYNSTVHGTENLRSAFAHSCNTAFANIGLSLDNGQFKKLAEQFLFNTQLPSPLPCSQSVFALKKGSSYGEQMTTAIGQGDTLVTPLHMALITATVANGGILMKPYIVSRVESSDGNVVRETKPEIYDELMTLEEAEILTGYMHETVLSGTGSALSWNSYSVAGKTGSAEYETGGATGTHSWFVGFSNVDDPDIVVAVIAEDGGTGSSTAVPIAQSVFDAYYYS